MLTTRREIKKKMAPWDEGLNPMRKYSRASPYGAASPTARLMAAPISSPLIEKGERFTAVARVVISRDRKPVGVGGGDLLRGAESSTAVPGGSRRRATDRWDLSDLDASADWHGLL
jgi:hypothetical protein